MYTLKQSQQARQAGFACRDCSLLLSSGCKTRDASLVFCTLSFTQSVVNQLICITGYCFPQTFICTHPCAAAIL